MLTMSPGGRAILVLAVAVAAGVGAYALTRARLEPAPLADAPVAEAEAAAARAVIPDLRPDVSLPGLDGRIRSLSEWNGRPQVINFWATWCAPCRREIPMLNALATDGRWPDVALVGIAIDFRDDVLRYVAANPVGYPVLIGEEDGLEASRKFGMQSLGLPFTAFVDRQGRIVTIHLGELKRPQADVILSVVRDLDDGKIDLKTAQARIAEEIPKVG